MITLELSGVPPSTNKAYFNLPRGGRALSAAGAKYKRETTSTLVRNFPLSLKLFEPNKPYGVLFVIHLPTVLNKGWPKSAETRYKKLDATNRVKLVEDALVLAAGVDDSQFLFSSVLKAPSEEEKTTIYCWSLDLEIFPSDVLTFLPTLFNS